VDALAGTGWRRVSVATDIGGRNAAAPGAGETFLDACDASPFNYVADEKITWAGPCASFRSDSVGYDFKWFSVREVGEGP
jgi:hypothetical protein